MLFNLDPFVYHGGFRPYGPDTLEIYAEVHSQNTFEITIKDKTTGQVIKSVIGTLTQTDEDKIKLEVLYKTVTTLGEVLVEALNELDRRRKGEV